MKLSFDRVLKTVDGEDLKWVDQSDKNKKAQNLTLGRACSNALFVDPEKISGEEKARKGTLAFRLANAKMEDVTIEELALMKQYVGEYMPTLVVTQVWKLLESKE